MENNTTSSLKISSTAFDHEGVIPSKYTCEGEEVNPPLQIDQIPASAKTLAIIVEDPDAPNGTFDHWLVWNIPHNQHALKENTIPPGIGGNNSEGKTGYMGPCPPSGSHRYYFHVYALDTELDLGVGADKKMLEQAMKGHILAEGSLMGRYERSK